MKLLVISSSLNPESKSRILAKMAWEVLEDKGHTVDWVDLRDFKLPICGDTESYGHEHVEEISARIKEADGILLAAPIHNYDVAASAKNLAEITSQSWYGKIVGLLVASGSHFSYMSPFHFMTSLMMHNRCVIVPRYVFAAGPQFSEERAILDPNVIGRIEQIANTLIDFTRGLDGIASKLKG